MNDISPRTSIAFLLLVILSAASLSGLAGCHFRQSRQTPVCTTVPLECQYSTPANVLVSQYYDQLKPHRVVIATPASENHLLPEQKKFALALANSLRQVGFSDAVVSPSCACDTQAIRKGKFDLQQLVDLSNEYSADAVLYCDVVSFSAYSPLQVSVSMTLVDAGESIAIMAIDGNWDLRDLQTQNSYLNYLSSNPLDSEFQSGVRFQSPTEFLNFVAVDAAKFMRDQ